MASKWEKVAESRDPKTGANKSLFLKTGVDSPHKPFQFKIKWQWRSNQKPYQKTLKDISLALDFYKGTSIASPVSEWDRTAMRESNQFLERFLKNKLAKITKEKKAQALIQKKNTETSIPAMKRPENGLIDRNQEKTAA